MTHLDKKIMELEQAKRRLEEQNSRRQEDQEDEERRAQAERAREERDVQWRQEIREGLRSGRIDIAGASVEFQPASFFHPGIRFLFPGEFLVCALDTAQQKVYRNEAHAVNIILQYTDHPGQPIDMKAMKDEMIRNMKSMELNTEWVEDGVKEVNGRPVHYCAFLNPVAQGKVFNFLFFADAGRKRLIGNINCSGKDSKLWSCIAQEMIASMEVAHG
ncbi:hypothetical protein WJ0W_005568 [Paenibacillus melissococcoides]|uniref:Uncharacterized protein n=1 Tax=Paenibacillus melissococcoides TaxID=2912268 RepID=A0ABM9GA98_9BACL|nr:MULTISPECIES: hypothetical protein [Paenibacillus]MEB9894551.1 hypothetical protein [Bacillus cereus]CAH8248311.1 hypothetical protein WJ0W_005568 [Paenibacillus melissococcoides]CAH8717861.1 hypothetical protein HTL2_005083 [Paenibacillus melissococcoides]CAH8719262.1 hypothetical protein WDD9_005490 [Paenibacillus melissococcoides]GIO80317.1 hypothetical protein J6TS7_39270 [Paenibacillus dendritiformis]